MGFTQQPTQYNCNILEQNVKTERKKVYYRISRELPRKGFQMTYHTAVTTSVATDSQHHSEN
jgi:hypothetical protein